MGIMAQKCAILFALLLLSISSIYAQDVGIKEDEKLLVWIADAQRPGQQKAQEPGQLVWIDSAGNFEPFMDVPLQTSHVMTCGQTSASSSDGESLAFYVGKDVGTLHILRGTDSLFVVDTDFHAMGCTGNGTFEFFRDSSKFAYIDYAPDSLAGSYGNGTLRIYNNLTFEQIRNFDNVTNFDVEGENVAYARFFANDRNEAIETAIVLWDGETDREVATLFAETDCVYNSASVKLLPNGNIIAIMGHRCSTGDTSTNWQYYIIDPNNRTATQITQNSQVGRFFAFSRTNSIYASPDGSTTFFTIPDGITNHTVSLQLVDMSGMSMTPVIDKNIIMPRYTNAPFADENHPSIQSPDGVWLSMVRNTADSDATLALYDLSQPNLPPIELSAGSRRSQIVEVEFTPDNNRVIYVAGGNNGDDNSLWGVDLASGNNFRIRRGKYGWGVVSPDGGRIALMNWVPTENNKPPYATLVIVDIDTTEETLLFQGGEVVNGDLTGVRFALPIAWRR
jgi:WD40 repeat protein